MFDTATLDALREFDFHGLIDAAAHGWVEGTHEGRTDAQREALLLDQAHMIADELPAVLVAKMVELGHDHADAVRVIQGMIAERALNIIHAAMTKQSIYSWLEAFESGAWEEETLIMRAALIFSLLVSADTE